MEHIRDWLEAAQMPTIMDFYVPMDNMAYVMFARPLTAYELGLLRALNLDVRDLGRLCSYRLQLASVEDADD